MKERYLLEDVSDNGFSLITDYDGNDEHAFDVNIKSGEILPVLPSVIWYYFPEYSCLSRLAESLH